MHHNHKSGGPLDYHHITDGIYIGTNQCCAVGLAEVLKKEGITADVSLEDVRVDHPFGVALYVWIPTPDHTPPSRDQLVFGVQSLKELRRQKRKVYVHCKNGHGRATTLVAAYLMSQGQSADEAFAFIQSKRPAVHLQPSQSEALQTF